MGGRLHFKAELLSQKSKLKIQKGVLPGKICYEHPDGKKSKVKSQKIVIGDMFLRNRKGCLWKMNE
jgi:hypothetical protein